MGAGILRLSVRSVIPQHGFTERFAGRDALRDSLP